MDREDPLGICRKCGRVDARLDEHDAGAPPTAIEVVDGAAPPEGESADPYRASTDEPELVVVLSHRQHTLNAARFVGVSVACAAVWRWSQMLVAPSDPLATEPSQLEYIMPAIILLIGGGIIAYLATPRPTRTRVRVTSSSLIIGRDGEPESRHSQVPLDEVEAVVARCESPGERDSDLRFEVAALDVDGRALVRISNLRETATARWLANAIEDAIGFEELGI